MFLGEDRTLMARPGQGGPDKRWVARSFGAAASRYDGLASLQRRIADELLSWLPVESAENATIVDLGAGTGYPTAHIAERFPDAALYALDIAEPMLPRIRARPGMAQRCGLICGDAESLPLADESVDLLFSNVALQWCGCLETAARECRRVLRPGGRLLFSTFTEGTLAALRDAWSEIDGHEHVNRFLSVEEVTAALSRAGLPASRREQRAYQSEYADVLGLMNDLKGLGAHNVLAGRRRGLIGRSVLKHLERKYRERGSDARPIARFEVLLMETRYV